MLGDNINGTVNTMTVDDNEIASLGNIGIIYLVSMMKGLSKLEARVSYNGMIAVRKGTLTVNRKCIFYHVSLLCK